MLPGAFAAEVHWELELDAGGGGVSLTDWRATDLGDRRVRRILKNILIFRGLVARNEQYAIPIVLEKARDLEGSRHAKGGHVTGRRRQYTESTEYRNFPSSR